MCLAALTPLGCGSAVAPTEAVPSQAVVIVTQPLTQTIPIGRSATFAVTATGSFPIQYQWSKNGIAITGANSNTYTTPVVAAVDSGSQFNVTVENSSSLVTSNNAELVAAARAPAFGDLRYLLNQQLTTTVPNGGAGVLLGLQEFSFTNAIGSPLQIGDVATSGCAWSSSVLFLPPGMSGLNMNYTENFTQSETYASYLQSIFASNVVVTSFDLEPVCGLAGVSWVQTVAGGNFDARIEYVNPSDVQAAVSADGAQSRIVTATSIDDTSGQVILISYGWTGDLQTVYDSSTVVASSANVTSSISTLADAGFFISAFGGNNKDGYVIVGMRVHGDSLARPINGSNPTLPLIPGTVVAWYGDANFIYTIYEQ